MLSSASEQTELPAAGGPSSGFHGRYLSLVACIERQFPVAGWRCEDVDLWPIARMALYLDMFWAQSGSTPPAPRAWPLRAAARLATPFTNAWKSRHDRTHCLTQATSAYAIVLGDGVCLDRVEGSWQDRFAEPLIDALERQGKTTFVMQQGALARLPWRRPTYSVNRLAAAGSALAKLRTRPVTLRGHADLLAFLASHGIPAPSLQAARLAWRARQAEAIAGLFQRTLQRVRPTLAFVVTYYAGLGAAFLAACRREHILSIDLQHCPPGGRPQGLPLRLAASAGLLDPAGTVLELDRRGCGPHRWLDARAVTAVASVGAWRAHPTRRLARRRPAAGAPRTAVVRNGRRRTTLHARDRAGAAADAEPVGAVARGEGTD